MDTTMQMRPAIPARIDRLPLSREIWGIMLLAGVAWLVESYDVGVMGSVLPSLQKEFQLGAFSVGLLAIASTLAIVIGVIPAGWMADTIGRKKILVIGTAWYSVFSLLCGFAPTPAALVVLRFVAGLGMGAIFPIPYAMAAELTPRHFRGAMTAILDSFLSVGYFVAPLIAFAVIPSMSQDMGWRVLFYIGGFPLLFVPALLKWMPESPRWLEVKGHAREADAIVSKLEHDIERRTGGQLPPPQIEAKGDTGNLDGGANRSTRQRGRYIQIFQRPYLKRTMMMWVAFSCILFIFYAIQTYTPTVLIQKGYAKATAFLLTAIIVIASIPGKYAAAFAVERFGRKATLIWFTGAAAIAAVLFGFLHNPVLSLSCGIILAFFGIGVDPVIKIYGAEQYPTRIRETGIGLFEGVGRLAAFAPVSGSYPPYPGGCHPVRPVPLLEFHGTADPIVPNKGSARNRYPPILTWLQGWATRDGCTRGPMVFYKQANVTGLEWTDCQGNATVIHYRIQGEGHIWPHVTFNVPGGAAVSSLSASALIWSFFQQHPLPATSPTG